MDICLRTEYIQIEIHHLHHKPYLDRSLTNEALQFIKDRLDTSTPSQIFLDLRATNIPGAQSVVQYQIYYQWRQGNKTKWCRDNDQIKSAEQLLTECPNVTPAILRAGNVRGIALYVRQSVAGLRGVAKELAMDATYGTNNAGLDLYAVLAEFDGTGVPLAYMFVEKQGKTSAGALTSLLEQFLGRLKEENFNPRFFGCDKDMAEISAIQSTWNGTVVQLCQWHVLRAIDQKLCGKKKTKLPAYRPEDALPLIPNLEICFGSQQVYRPDGEHRRKNCQCRSKNVDIDEKGSEAVPADIRKNLKDMIKCHLNAHPMIPDRNGVRHSPAEIHSRSATEAYEWCKLHNLPRLWAYLFVNWYRLDQWVLWGRSVNPGQIPILKTTMILESHWTKLKHQYLHNFNRPRIDLVSWILTSRVIPEAMYRWQALANSNDDRNKAGWRKAFKFEWNKLRKTGCEREKQTKYQTDPNIWVCGCEYYLTRRFLLCKHLVHACQPLTNNVEFFSDVRRRRTAPFLSHPQIQPLPEFRSYDPNLRRNLEDRTEEDQEELPEIDPAAFGDDQLVGLEDDGGDADFDKHSRICNDLHELADLCNRQRNLGNKEFMDRAEDDLSKALGLLEEIRSVRRRRHMPQTWERYRYTATRYFK